VDWNAAADAVIKIGREFGLWAILLAGGLAVVWKALDAWGKRGK